GILFTSVTGGTTVEFPEYQPMDIGVELRNKELDFEFNGLETQASTSSSKLRTADVVGSIKIYCTIDWVAGSYIFTWYKLRYIGVDVEIWTRCYPDGTDRFDWPAGDPRPTPVVTDEQIAYLAAEFSSNILPTVTAYFGMPDSHYGLDQGAKDILPPVYWPYLPDPEPTGRNVILVSNFVDDNYYDPTYPYFVIGVFSPTLEGWFDRNIISIDAYNWENYVGGPGAQYEGTIAHEYQHLIHDDYQPIKTPFMNEGCSMFAEILCGYPTDWSSINSFLATPDNSLTEWGDQGGINILADYGQGLLFATYLEDNYGPHFLKDYVQHHITGIAGIEALLPSGILFDDVFKDWTLDILMRTGYTTINFNDKAAGDLGINEVKDKWPDLYGTDFGNTITILGYDTGVSALGSYGTDYIRLSKLKWQYPSELYFDGDENVAIPEWIYDGDLWYSTSAGAWSDLELLLDVDLSGPGIDTLSVLTRYSIEDYWDYGFVQIFNTDTNEWETLDDGVYCTYLHDSDAASQIVAELPGLTGTQDWVTLNFDLFAYEGQITTVRFRYMTDGAVNYPGWWIDTVYLNGVEFSDDSLYTPPFPATSFIVTVLRETFIEGVYYYDELATLDWDPVLNDGVIDLEPYLASIGEDLRYPDVMLLISPRLGPADYHISVVRK
ncbi:MAG: hypothetical protein ACFE75_13310, partial [Candidatus Hodarchaeota archaeon]